MLLSDYITQAQNLVHDSSSLDFQTADWTLYINEARNRVALDFWCVRSYFSSLTTVINQETYPIGGGVGGAKVTAGGIYSTPPTVTFGAPPAGGVQATGVALMGGSGSNQFVQQIGMTNWGSGYTSVPTVTFGSGAAAATAIALLNVFDIYTISVQSPPGGVGLQRQALLWAPFGTFNAVLRMNAVSSGKPAVWSGYNEQNLFYVYPAQPDTNYALEIDAFVLPTPLVNTTDSDTQINPPLNELVQYQAAYKALLKGQNFDQADYYDKKYDKRAKEMGASRFAPRRTNIYQNTWRRVQRGYF